jgi:hypothetical protein
MSTSSATGTDRLSAQSSIVDSWDQGRRALRLAALSYVERGWPVVPGPLCDGLRYTRPEYPHVVAAAKPVASTQDASLDSRLVERWWTERPHTVLSPVGVGFDVLCAPTLLATVATGLPVFRENLCPVAMSPQGARFLVARGGVLDEDLAGVRGLEFLAGGEFLPLPPSRVVGGSMNWWITPAAAGGRLGDAKTVQAALRAARLPALGAV